MSLTQESQLICRGLDEFCLPAALINVRSDRALQWNTSFLTAIGCTPVELKALPISELVQLDLTEGSHSWECEHAPVPIHLEPCLIRNAQTRAFLPGRSFRRDDFAFVIVDPAPEKADEENFQTGRATGEQAERERVRTMLHRGVSQNLVAISFSLARYQNLLSEGGAITMEELQQLNRMVEEAALALREAMLPPQDKESQEQGARSK